jgi:hypothetical protein
MKKRMFAAAMSVLLFLSGCDTDSEKSSDIINIDSCRPIILLSYVYFNQGPGSKLQLINSDKAYSVFSDGVMRSYPSLSPDKSKIVYLYNFAFIPMYGWYGEPSIKIYDLTERKEVMILPEPSSGFYISPVWIGNNRIAVQKYTDNALKLLIVGLDGVTEKEKEMNTAQACEQYVSPDNNFIVMSSDSLMIYDIAADTFFMPGTAIAFSSKPIFYNGGFYFNSGSGTKFYNFADGSLSDYETNGELCFINDRIIITKLDNYLKLTDTDLNPVGSVPLLYNSRYYGSLQSYCDSTFYYYGENNSVDDEGAVYIVDFKNLNVKKITDNGEDTIIMNINSFY